MLSQRKIPKLKAIKYRAQHDLYHARLYQVDEFLLSKLKVVKWIFRFYLTKVIPMTSGFMKCGEIILVVLVISLKWMVLQNINVTNIEY